MITLKNINKTFDKYKVLDDINFNINDGDTFGLIGTNGAGKSTILRIISRIYKEDSGEILVDEKNLEKNQHLKENIFYVSDEQYFLLNATPSLLIDFYKKYYASFDEMKAKKLLGDFYLDVRRKVKTFSKGMKKQLSIILALASGTKYVLLDETFDGLDPVMRQAVKSLIASEMTERGLTTVIASHNLRELEDISGSIGLLHKGKLIMSNALDDMKLGIHRVQVIFKENSYESMLKTLNIIRTEEHGKLKVMIIKGDKEELIKTFDEMNCLFYEMLPLTLEEIFISEAEEVGYDVKSIIG